MKKPKSWSCGNRALYNHLGNWVEVTIVGMEWGENYTVRMNEFPYLNYKIPNERICEMLKEIGVGK